MISSLKSFEGNLSWLGGRIHISLYVDKDNKSGITKAKKGSENNGFGTGKMGCGPA